MKTLIVALVGAALASSTWAAECRSIGGHLNGRQVKAVRHVTVKGNRLTLSGMFDGQRSPRRSLPCKKMKTGYYCERMFEGALVTVMTNGDRMIENIKDASSGGELAGVAYRCDSQI